MAIGGISPALRGGAMSIGGISPALRGGAMSIGGISPALRGGAMSMRGLRRAAAHGACMLVALAAPWLASCERTSEPRTEAPEPAPAAVPATEPASASSAPGARTAGLPKVTFLGDSISAGLHLPADQAFPALLARRLRAQPHAFQLINAGVSGDTTAGGLRRVDWILKQRPDVVVVELGANDGLRGVPIETIERNLRAIVEKVRDAGAIPLLLGMRLPPSYGADYAAGFQAIYPRVARELGVAHVPFFMQGVAGVSALNLEDGLHPTASGHEQLATNVEPALREAIATAQRTRQPR
jgi:acyl-CoA thioesterase-1